MLIVSDTSPLGYLVEIGCADVLRQLYVDVITTPQVIGELRQRHFPAIEQQWAEGPPDWLRIRTPKTVSFLDRLDMGEASSVSLACELRASFILMDERVGRAVARGLGLEPRGTLGTIVLAGVRGCIDFEAAVRLLTTQTRFRHTPDLIAEARRQYELMRPR